MQSTPDGYGLGTEEQLWQEFLLTRDQALAEAGRDPVIRSKLKSLPRSRGVADLHFALAMCWRALRETEREYTHLRSALEAEPDHGEALYVLCYGLMERGEYAESQVYLRRRLEACPDDRDAWVGLGYCAFYLGDYAEAATSLRRSLDLGHDNVNVLGMLTRSCTALGHYEAAVEYGERCLGASEKPVEDVAARHCLAWSHRALAQRAEEAGDLEIAVRWIERACIYSPAEAVNWYALGRLLSECRRWKEAEVPLVRALELGYEERDARLVLAGVLFECGRYADAALEACRCLGRVEDARTHAWLHSVAAFGCEADRDVEGALVHRQQAAILNPDEARYAQDFGVKLIQMERFAEAKTELERAMTLARTAEERDCSSVTLAQALIALGKFAEAEESLRALYGTTQHDTAIAQWVDLCVSQGRFSEALAVSRQEVEQRPESGVAHACLGFVLLHVGQDEEAQTHLNLARQLQPANPWVDWLTQGRMERVQFPTD